MTARETIINKPHGTDEEWITFTEVEELMKEYAENKCQELLEIVAEKAELKIDCLLDSYYNIDKDSILNAVNLDEFIK